MAEFIAKIIILGEQFLKYLAFFMGVMAIIWIFQLMRDPGKQLDLAMDLFKNIFIWTWKGILLIWMAIMYVVNLIIRVFAITFATIRDFFVSKN
jgi:uncharacterized protein with ParB-like and HNH nuclease domain|tara:strand:+ start:480 stop:761 length:282 start_codon:yes stop_codon:yes gene_type:complete